MADMLKHYGYMLQNIIISKILPRELSKRFIHIQQIYTHSYATAVQGITHPVWTMVRHIAQVWEWWISQMPQRFELG